jgi:hypothetical protein
MYIHCVCVCVCVVCVSYINIDICIYIFKRYPLNSQEGFVDLKKTLREKA